MFSWRYTGTAVQIARREHCDTAGVTRWRHLKSRMHAELCHFFFWGGGGGAGKQKVHFLPGKGKLFVTSAIKNELFGRKRLF